ncbi:cysteine desulfurase family protein [Siphonobacter sp. SORGH_AS_1065]|uniref:cysteine desulfurase family protein n=1 Tax=Siphonobacter sp. SORGH_AS_1065 TaxID=3041795 RepID=UPI00277EF477|nr:cysteine desulfurase family protein [Siphonobacter sp. SORGH_AS_1065]MDQ1089964.1 cysteine desulfurase [Siphonobacter sp. SORGH_AS_1065]
MSIYLDNSATTALSPAVLEAIIPYFTQHFGNASSNHWAGREAKKVIQSSRRQIADLLNITPEEIIFTSGGTEADNFALKSSIQHFNIRHVLTSKIEHKAVLLPLKQLEQAGLIQVHYVQLDEQGRVSIPDLTQWLEKHPNGLVSLMHANNELGTLLDLEEVHSLTQHYGAYFHTDTVQSIGKVPVNLHAVDFATASAHKFRGPKGVGFLFARQGHRLPAFISGGGQEGGQRGGTENIPGIVGLTKALELAITHQTQNIAHLNSLKQQFIDEIQRQIPGVLFNGRCQSIEESLPGLINVAFPILDGPCSLVEALDARGIAVSGGSACSNLAGGSHVLQEIPTSFGKENVRFSFGADNTFEEINEVLSILSELYQTEEVSLAS